MASIIRTVADGTLAVYPVSFPYLDKSHVKVYKNGTLVPSTDYTWPTSGSIQFNAGLVAAGTIVTRRRVTPTFPLTTFTPGNLDTDDLNIAILQPLYLAEEGKDGADLAWQAFGAELPGTISKQGAVATEVPMFNSDGNLQPSGVTTGSIAGAAAAAAAAIAAAAQAVLVAAGIAALVPSISSYVVSHYDALASATIPASINQITLGGRKAFGDVAGFIPCTRSLTAPVTHNGYGQSADGAYWVFQTGNQNNAAAFGAFVVGLTDNFAAFDGALNYIKNSGLGYGAVYVPPAPGAYLSKDTLILSTRVIAFYAQIEGITIYVGDADKTVMRVDKGISHVRYCSFYGAGAPGLPGARTDIGTITAPAFWVNSAAVNVKVEHCQLYGGSNAFWAGGGDNKFYDLEVSQAYGNALCLISGGHHFRRNAMDQAYPVIQPSDWQVLPNTINPWVASTSYSYGDFILVGGYILQACWTNPSTTTPGVIGTSHATTPPVPKPYFTRSLDNGNLSWLLVCPNDFIGLNMAYDAEEVFIDNQDLSGCLTVGINVPNSNVVLRLKVKDCIIGQTLRQGIILTGGKDITIRDIHTGTGFQAGFACVQISDTCNAHIRLSKNYLEGGHISIWDARVVPNTGFVIADGNYLAPRKGATGAFAHAYDVVAGQKNFHITDNDIASSADRGISVAAGASDHYVITGNINGAGLARSAFVADGGTGLNKVVNNPGGTNYPRQEVLLFEAVLNYNITTDQALAIKYPCASWEITRIRSAKNSGDISAVLYGLYTGAGATGVVLVAAGSDLAAVTAVGKATTAAPTAEGLDEQTAQTIYFKASVAAGAARTGTYSIYGYPLQ